MQFGGVASQTPFEQVPRLPLKQKFPSPALLQLVVDWLGSQTWQLLIPLVVLGAYDVPSMVQPSSQVLLSQYNPEPQEEPSLTVDQSFAFWRELHCWHGLSGLGS